ncbi:mitogen-activated protein kinase kinase kinase 15-like isoform X4 [Bolinopsis microptera]|uniref:mitogen-activated protein kinase kinase kinase 15-like isoform X4 n=1 Tax=Bolinopsis microptera TaxID=2820187 RepID=UPI00307A661C
MDSTHHEPKQKTLVGVFHDLPETLKAWEVVKKIATGTGEKYSYDCELILFEELLEINKGSRFCNADVAVVDFSVREQCADLSYNLGVRMFWEMTNSIVVMWDRDPNQTLIVKTQVTPNKYKFIPYTINEQGQILLSDDYGQNQVLFKKRFKETIKNLQPVKRKHLKMFFHRDLRRARESKNNLNLTNYKRELRKFERMIKEQPEELYCTDTIHDLLISYRDIKDYKSMISFVDSLPDNSAKSHQHIQYLYAFALERHSPDDHSERDRALEILLKLMKNKDNLTDIPSLCGRIYKSKYEASGRTNTEYLDLAIEWYEKGFKAQKNLLAGINLACLIVLKGEEPSTNYQLHSLCIDIGELLGKKGQLEEITDYWDLATSFELNVIQRMYKHSNRAALCMFNLKPEQWMLESTMANIRLIESHRPKTETVQSNDQNIYHFWTDFFTDASRIETTEDFHFRVLILEDHLPGIRKEKYVPSMIIVHTDGDEDGVTTIDITHIALPHAKMERQNTEELEERVQLKWSYPLERIVNKSTANKDDRRVVIYVNPDDFDLHFPSAALRNRFLDIISPYVMQAEQDDDKKDTIELEYERDARGEKQILGRGTYGVVYSAIDKLTKRKIAVKEITIQDGDDSQIQYLVEEIALHQRLKNKNIVSYLGCEREGVTVRIFMEQVPGGSLSKLIKNIWGPLKGQEPAMSHYTRQIIEGLIYLHKQNIVHRDIKPDNILIDMYRGTLKISDFGTSKRIQGLCQKMVNLKGTPQFMAPEVIRAGARGYGPPADIWSLGCTLLEMATGQTPFHELRSEYQVYYKIGKCISPALPDDVSEELIDFLKSCFIPDEEKRPTAQQLLESAFIEKHRKHYLRSASGPLSTVASNPGQAIVPHQSYGTHSSTSPDYINKSMSMETKKQPRGSASDMSPNPGIIVSPADGSGSLDPLLRHTKGKEKLLNIFNNNKILICQTWMKHLQETSRSSVWSVTEDLLSKLLEYITQFVASEGDIQTKHTISTIATTTKNSLEQVQVAVEAFPDAVQGIIKDHSDEPHWMLVIQPMVKKAVWSVREALQPGEQKLSRLTSMDTETPSDSALRQSPSCASEENQLNFRRLTEIQDDFFRRLGEQQEELFRKFFRSQTEMYNVLSTELRNGNGKRPFPSGSSTEDDIDKYHDQDLVAWLRFNQFPDETIRKIIREEFTLTDFNKSVTKDDLRDIGLKIGPRCRLWECITKLQQSGHHMQNGIHR